MRTTSGILSPLIGSGLLAQGSPPPRQTSDITIHGARDVQARDRHARTQRPMDAIVSATSAAAAALALGDQLGAIAPGFDADLILFEHNGANMSDEMGTFRTDVEIENPIRPGERRILRGVLVDTGAELSSFPASLLDSLGIDRRKYLNFRQANGTVLSRWTGPAFVYVAGTSTTDDVVFGEPGDLVLLGARSLEGLNLHVDPIGKRLIDAGPMPAAAAEV